MVTAGLGGSERSSRYVHPVYGATCEHEADYEGGVKGLHELLTKS